MGMRNAINANRLDKAKKADDLTKKATAAHHAGDQASFKELARQAAEVRQELEDGE